MSSSSPTLVMAGAREAHGIVAGLLAQGDPVLTSLPEPERMFEPFQVPTHTGRFETPGAFADWLGANRISRVVDASHAFDTGVCEMAQGVCRQLSLPYLRVLRAEWQETEADNWLHVTSVREAADAAPASARLFSNTGWLSMPECAGFAGERLFLRQTHPVVNDPPYGFVTLLPGTPPFSVDEEESLFKELRITHLICRNVGGEASASKLIAARRLGLPVYMVARTPLATGVERAKTIDEALVWCACQ